MDGQDFLGIIHAAYAPFLKSLGFSEGETSISGRHYRADFFTSKNKISISFEPGDDYSNVYILSVHNGVLSKIDDSPRISDLNQRYMALVSSQEREENQKFFQDIVAKDEHEKTLLKMAKDLRLVLPKYISEIGKY